MKVNFRFQLKGERPYIRGAEIYAAVIAMVQARGLGELQAIDMSFHALAAHQLEGRLVKGKQASLQDKLVLHAHLNIANEVYTLSLYPSEERVSERVPYDSSLIKTGAQLDIAAKSIRLAGLPGVSMINKVIALNKLLLKALFRAEEGIWFFVKLQLSQPLENFPEDEEVEIELLRSLGTRFTKSAIRIDGEEVGFVNYSLYPKE